MSKVNIIAKNLNRALIEALEITTQGFEALLKDFLLQADKSPYTSRDSHALAACTRAMMLVPNMQLIAMARRELRLDTHGVTMETSTTEN